MQQPSELPAAGRLGRLIGVAAWLLAAAYLLPFLHQGWIAHDDGLLGQVGQRTLAGEMPHRDFDDPYTGGLSWLYAAAFALLGVELTATRWVLLAATMLALPFVYALARRATGPLAAAGVTLLAVVWSVPNYFAGLPSWYNLWLVFPALWCLERHGDDGRRRWLLLAGLAAGVSCLIKISGLFLLAALLLAVACRALDAPREPKGVGGRTLLAVFAVGCAATLILALVRLVQPLMAAGGTAHGLSVLGHFVLPIAALAGWIAYRAVGHDDAARVLGTAWRDSLWLLLGWALPLLALLAVFARAGALPDLYRGLFVLPRLRFAEVAVQVPAPWTLLVGVPVVALLLPWRRARRWRGPTTAVLLAVVLGGVLLRADHDRVYTTLWQLLRALVPAAVVAGLLVARRLPSGRDRRLVIALLAGLAWMNLIQIPEGFGVYFYYVAPVLMLTIAVLSSHLPKPQALPAMVLLTFLGGLAFFWLNGADPQAVGWRWRPVPAETPLAVPRGGILIRAAEAAVYERLVATVQAQVPPDRPIWAAPDCPEVYFLTERRNPTRTFYDFFDRIDTDAASLLARLDTWGVPLVVINQRPGFSPQVPSAVVREIAARYPNHGQIGPFLVFWRDPSTPLAGPLRP